MYYVVLGTIRVTWDSRQYNMVPLDIAVLLITSQSSYTIGTSYFNSDHQHNINTEDHSVRLKFHGMLHN